ncbi:MAG: pitrilysin family protein [Elusimicrobia bacterium]|nr:pitrilysin family protein [Elusimicrobiota bacterium]
MKKIFFALILLLLTTPIFSGGNVNIFTLSNGLKAIHKEIAENPLATIQLFLKNGSILEKENQAGILNFTQMLMMQGTKDLNSEQLASEIEDIGGSISSDVAEDYASIGISVMDSKFEKASKILSNIVTEPVFPQGEIEKERINVLAAIQSRKDNISSTAEDIFAKTFYGNHPYSWPDIGKEDSVSKFKREDLVNWHKLNYFSENMVLVIVGNLSLDTAKKTAEKYFSKINKGTAIKEIRKPEVPKAQKVVSENKKFKQAYLIVGFPAPSFNENGYIELKMINTILGSRMTARLFTELREKLSLAYEVNSAFPTRKELSRFIIYIGLEKKNIELAEKRIFEILQDLENNPVNDKELNEAKNYIRGAYLLDHQTISRKAWYIGWWEMLGKGYDYDQKYIEDLMAVTPEQIQKAAKKYFTGQSVTVEVVPE